MLMDGGGCQGQAQGRKCVDRNILNWLDLESIYGNIVSMKTTIDIPIEELRDLMKLSDAKTKKAAILTAVSDYNRRQRMALLTRHLGTCQNLITPDELAQLRKEE